MSNVELTAAQKAKKQKKQILLFGLSSALALVVCMATVLVVAFSLISDVYEFEPQTVESLTPLPETKGETVDFLSELVAGAKNNNVVCVSTQTSVGIDTSDIEFDGSENELNVLLHMKDKILGSIDALYPENHDGKFGEGFTAFPTFVLTGSDCTDAVCTQGVANEDGEITDDGYYFFTLTAKGGEYPSASGNVYDTFSLGGVTEIAKAIEETAKPIVNVVAATVTPADFTVTAKSDRLTDRLEHINFERAYRVELTLEFVGDFSAIGTKNIAFDYYVTDEYSYKWVNIAFVEDTVFIEKGANESIAPKAVMNDYDEYEISFESSDESVATIDAMGYVTGVSTSEKPVEITAKLSYLGNDYTAKCLVYVTVPVEKVKISDDSAVLDCGQSLELGATVKPTEATIADVLWISSDESVVTVDENGKVLAVGAGEATVTVVTVDGHFADACEITVKEEG